MQGQRDCAHFTGEDFSIASTEPQGLSARFLVDLTKEGAGSEEESDERPSKTVAKRWQRSKEVTEETVPGVASVQARAPARREAGREFQALGHVEQKDRSPTVFSLKVGTAKEGKSDDLRARTGVKSLISSVR